MIKPKIQSAFLLLVFACTAALADECPGGSKSAAECQKILKTLERQLVLASAKTEKNLTKEYGTEGYGGTEGLAYMQEAIAAFRASNKAWRQFRDTECWYLALRDGMSMSYAGPVAEACKVERTEIRLKELNR